jgi:hypothetical protein
MNWIANVGVGIAVVFNIFVGGVIGLFRLSHNSQTVISPPVTTTAAQRNNDTIPPQQGASQNVVGSGGFGVVIHPPLPSPTATTAGPGGSPILPNCPATTTVIDVEGNSSLVLKTSTNVYANVYGVASPLTAADCPVISNADSNTFVALNEFYGEDTNGVWLFSNPPEADDELQDLPLQIVGADVKTFSLIAVPTDGFRPEPFSGLYTKDKNHVYVYGHILDGADPATFVLDDPVAATSEPPYTFPCLVDAHDRQHDYFNGAEISDSYCVGKQ